MSRLLQLLRSFLQRDKFDEVFGLFTLQTFSD